MIFEACGIVRGTSYLGRIVAPSAGAAIIEATETASVSVCHQCAKQLEEPHITGATAEAAGAGCFDVYAAVEGTKFLGRFAASTVEEAEAAAFQSEEAYVSLCHHCASQCEDPEIAEVTLERIA